MQEKRKSAEVGKGRKRSPPHQHEKQKINNEEGEKRGNSKQQCS